MDSFEDNDHQVFVRQLEMPDPEDSYTRNYYEENGVLWVFSPEDLGYVPLLDFNLEVGDIVDNWYEVIWKGPVTIEDVERCVMAITAKGAKKVYYWIEGIGDVDDMYVSSMPAFVGERTRMTECRMGDKCLFNYDRMDEYMAGIDLSGVKSMTSQQNTDDTIYDMLGRRISAPVPGQLYIKDGRKHIGN